MKRFLSILTAIALCLCTFTMTVTATEPIASSGLTKNLEVSSKLTGTKVYTYTDGDANSIGVYISQSGSVTLGSNSKTNKSSSISNYAYGVYIEDGGSAIITAGTFSSNYCGIYVAGSGSLLSVSGATVISGNTYTSGGKTVNRNVYLDDGALITLRALSSGAEIGVTTNTKPTAGNPVQITTAETGTTTYYKTALQYFFSDDPTYDIRINETGGYLELYLPVESAVTADKNIENGSVTFSSDTAYSDEIVTVTPTADKGYEVDEVTYTYNNGTKDVTTTITPSNGVYSFTMPDYAVTVSATFKASVYSVSTSRCSNGSVAVSSTSAIADTAITVTPTADEGYEVDTVTYTYNDGTDNITATIEPDTEGYYSFTMPYYNVTVSVTFKKSVSETEPIDSSELSAWASVGSDSSFESTGGSLTLKENYVRIGIYEYGSGSVSLGSNCSISGYIYGIYATGDSTLTITGGSYADNYVGVYVDSNVTFNLSGAPVISGNAYTSGTDTVDCNLYLDDGALIILGELTDGTSIGITTYIKPTAGNPVQITTAETGTTYYETALQYFHSDDPNYVITVNETYGYLQLSVPEYEVAVDTEIENGSIAVSLESAGEGAKVTVTPTAAESYEVETVTYTYNDGTDDIIATIQPDTEGYYIFTMPAYPVTVSATFKQSIFSVTASESSNGSVTISPESASAGTVVTVTPTAEEGYEVDTVTYTYYNGTEYVTTTINLTNGAYSFTMPEYAVTVNVTFKKSTYSVITSSTTNGTVTVDNPSASMGDIVTITATANSLYKVKNVIVTDGAGNTLTVTDNGNGTYSFTMPAGTVTVSVTFYQYTSAVSGVIYINEQYHGVFVGGHLASIPHTVDENGYCTVCHEYIGVATEETADITEEIVEIDEPVEAGETDTE